MIRLKNSRGLVVARVAEPTRSAIETTLPEDLWAEVTFDKDDLAAYHKQQVRDEAQSRMMSLLGARNRRHLDILISNGAREAIRLLNKDDKKWTPEDRKRAFKLNELDQSIEAIRAASAALENKTVVPPDFRDDRWWPELPAH